MSDSVASVSTSSDNQSVSTGADILALVNSNATASMSNSVVLDTMDSVSTVPAGPTPNDVLPMSTNTVQDLSSEVDPHKAVDIVGDNGEVLLQLIVPAGKMIFHYSLISYY